MKSEFEYFIEVLKEYQWNSLNPTTLTAALEAHKRYNEACERHDQFLRDCENDLAPNQ